MKRASEVPPVVDSSGVTPDTEATASAARAVKSPSGVRKASPLMAAVSETRPSNPSPALAHSASSQATRSAPLWPGLNRMFRPAFAVAGITLVAALPTSTVVTSRFEGWKPV